MSEQSNPFWREKQRRVLERAADPNWPRCTDCNEPLTKADVKRKNARCQTCIESLRQLRDRNRDDGYIPQSRPY